MPPNNQFWSSERLEAFALSEARQHGADERYLDLLREQFRKAAEIKSGDAVSDENTSAQTGDIPS